MGKDAQGPFDAIHFLKGGLAGGICCGVTHGALCPIDVVKTRIQLEPQVYNRGMIAGFGQVVEKEGVMALGTGLGPAVEGYFVQGFFKFGGVGLFKVKATEFLGDKKAYENRMAIYLAAAASAEFVADVFLSPLEATRIRLVSDPSYASGLIGAFPKILKNEGIFRGLYSGFAPILFKLISYTMAKFAVQGFAAGKIYQGAGLTPKTASETAKMSIALPFGVIVGVASVIISHPADTLLPMVNREGAEGTGSIMSRLFNLAGEAGFSKLFPNSLGPRCVMIGTLTAGQFAIYDSVMDLTGASKFHFVNPDAKE